jgi:hypothetical protein
LHEKNKNGIAYGTLRKSIIKQSGKSFSADGKRVKQYTFTTIDTLSNRIFTYNDLKYIKSKLPVMGKYEWTGIYYFDGKKSPLFIFEQEKRITEHYGIINEIPIVKMNNRIYINTGDCSENIRNELENSLLMHYDKYYTDTIMNRFDKGIIIRGYYPRISFNFFE